MNIEDITQKIEVPKESLIATIFDHQRTLMIRYDEIERKNGFKVPEFPYHIENAQVQARIKDMFWRTTEELAEALETIPTVSYLQNWPAHWDSDVEVRHFFEEITDALHFLVEASIIANLDPQEVQTLSTSIFNYQAFREQTYRTLRLIKQIPMALGSTANILKNKPWKQTQMCTDTKKFKENFLISWRHFLEMWACLDCKEVHLYIFYTKKNLVNQWRQKTKY